MFETALKRVHSACQALSDLTGERSDETPVNSSMLLLGVEVGRTNTDAVVLWGDQVI